MCDEHIRLLKRKTSKARSIYMIEASSFVCVVKQHYGFKMPNQVESLELTENVMFRMLSANVDWF